MPKDTQTTETGETLAKIAETVAAHITSDAVPTVIVTAPPPTPMTAPGDPMDRGITAIRTEDPDAMKIWSVKGPKQQAGSEIYGVLTDGAVVLIHQLASGRFKVYKAV